MLLAVVLTAGWMGLVQFRLKILIYLYLSTPLATHLALPTDVEVSRLDVILTAPLPYALSAGMVTRPASIETEHISHKVTYSGTKSLRSAGVTSDIENITPASGFCLPDSTGDHIYACIAARPIPVIVDRFFKKLFDSVRSVPRHLPPPSLVNVTETKATRTNIGFQE